MSTDDGYPGMPRWMKWFAALALLLLVVFAVVHLAGGGFRGHGGSATHPSPEPR
jgi:hypothetical protein